MIDHGFISAERSMHDHRSVRVKLTQKGLTLRDRLSDMQQRHLKLLDQSTMTEADLQRCLAVLEQLERFWSYGSRAQPLSASTQA